VEGWSCELRICDVNVMSFLLRFAYFIKRIVAYNFYAPSEIVSPCSTKNYVRFWISLNEVDVFVVHCTPRRADIFCRLNDNDYHRFSIFFPRVREEHYSV